MKLEREVFLIGIWANFDEIEENLTLEELEEILKAAREREHREFKFFAALKGIDLDDGQVDEETRTIEDVKRELEAERTGQSMGYLQMRDDFAGVGFGVELVEE